jgi:hypothetical protein
MYRSVRLASSLTAALLNGLFEHPLWIFPSPRDLLAHVCMIPTLSFNSLLGIC